jgi:hypothetical protein
MQLNNLSRGLMAAVLAAGTFVSPTSGQSLGPDFAPGYNIRDLGAIAGVPEPNGALLFAPDDPNSLIASGNANFYDAQLFKISVKRDLSGHITGFIDPAVFFANVPGTVDESGNLTSGIDGGLDYYSGGMYFYSTFNDGSISQFKPGEVQPAKQTRFSQIGVEGEGGGLLFVPPGLPGAGRLKITSYSGDKWYDTTIVSNSAGTYDIQLPSHIIDLPGDPEGFAYVKAGSPGFSRPSVLVALYMDNKIVAYEVDANGDPIPATQRDFVTDLNGATGATRDPVTGDFIFTSFEDPRIFVVGGFTVANLTVRFTEPTNNAQFSNPASFPLAVEADQQGGLISQVEFSNGSELIGSLTSPPFRFYVNNLMAGDYVFTAVAHGQGGQTASASVKVKVVNDGPLITLLSITNNAQLRECTDLWLDTAVTAQSGAIVQGDFYEDGQVIGTLSIAPFRFWVKHLTAGTHTFATKVTDANGLSAMAIVTNILVQPLPTNSFAIHHYTPNQILVCFRGEPGSSYVWEATSTLADLQLPNPVWTPFLTNTAASQTYHRTNDFNSKGIGEFYRARMVLTQ